jgi:hypothetical protein
LRFSTQSSRDEVIYSKEVAISSVLHLAKTRRASAIAQRLVWPGVCPGCSTQCHVIVVAVGGMCIALLQWVMAHQHHDHEKSVWTLLLLFIS